jgi:arylsulfatase A-like enzyme
MRTERYRYTEWTVPNTEFRAIELYDHERDPQENVNVAQRPENAALVKQLSAQLRAGWRAALP